MPCIIPGCDHLQNSSVSLLNKLLEEDSWERRQLSREWAWFQRRQWTRPQRFRTHILYWLYTDFNCCQTKNVLPNCLRFCPIAFTWFNASLSQKRLSPRHCPRGESQVVKRLLVSGFLRCETNSSATCFVVNSLRDVLVWLLSFLGWHDPGSWVYFHLLGNFCDL